MNKIFWLIQDKLAGRPGPDTEQWDLISLREGGIGAILSVNDGRMCDPKELQSQGINYLCTPFSDYASPIPGNEKICLAALPKAYAFAKNEIEKGHGVIVHCSAGKDRTGLFLSYFLIQQNGLSPKEAMQAVRKVRPIAFTAWGWGPFAELVLESSL